MTARTQLITISAMLALIVFPVLIVQGQSEGETDAPPASEVVAETAEAAAAAPDEPNTQDGEPAQPVEQEGTVLGAESSTEASSSSDAGVGAGSSEPASAGDQTAAPELSTETASTTVPEFLTLDTASSTANSTEPVADPPAEEPTPIEEPFVLQAAVTLHLDGTSIAADIELENLTCKSCEKVLPAAQVKAYYAAWYPNDGPDLKEVGERFAEQAIEVSDVALWASRSMSWSASDVATGRYYFVVVVDPENAIGAYRMHRSEFSI